MTARGPFARVLLWFAVLSAAALGVAGGLSLRGPGLVAVGLAATLAACTAAGIARESTRPTRRSTIEAAVHGAAWTVGALLVLSGVAALASPAVAVVLVGAVLGAWLIRAVMRSRSAGKAAPPAAPAGAEAPHHPAHAPDLGRTAPVPLPLPVWTLTTPALGQEWLTTTVLLAGRLDPTARHSVVGRREEALDELERRDPDGFAQWLAAGTTGHSDPADYVRGGPVLDGPATDADAA